VFLLNALVRYWDYEQNGILDDIIAPTTYQEIFILGAVGPFGIAFPESENDRCIDFLFYKPDWRLPLIEPYHPVKPIQEDSYNCGVYVILFMLDFIKTQCTYDYSFTNVKNEAGDLYVRGSNYKEHVITLSTVLLPPTNRLGYGFFLEPMELDGNDTQLICQMIRMELVVLMERAHCVYYSTFSNDGMHPNTGVLGVVSDQYQLLLATHRLAGKALAKQEEDKASIDSVVARATENFKKDTALFDLMQAEERMMEEQYYRQSPAEQFQSYASTLYDNDSSVESHIQYITQTSVAFWTTMHLFQTSNNTTADVGAAAAQNRDYLEVPETPDLPATSNKSPLDICSTDPKISGTTNLLTGDATAPNIHQPVNLLKALDSEALRDPVLQGKEGSQGMEVNVHANTVPTQDIVGANFV
jgi:hypothetical protein